MAKSPEISVLMSVYNTDEKYLHKSIQSILKQTYSDFEFIIILDCPTDGSAQIVEEYAKKDNRIRIIRNEENLGLTRSLNVGMDGCRGKYIARMDSDDYSLPDRFMIQHTYMEAHIDIAAVGARTITPGTLKTTQSNCIDDREIKQIRMMFSNCGLPHPTAFIRASFLKEYGIKYDERIIKSQDYKLWNEILKYGNIIMLPDILLVYRVHENQISTGDPHRKNTYSLQITKENCKSFLGRELTEREVDVVRTLYISDFIDCDKYDMQQFFDLIVERNKEIKKFDENILHRELCFIWILKALRRIKNEKDFSMLNAKYFKPFNTNVLKYTICNLKMENAYKKAVKCATIPEEIL